MNSLDQFGSEVDDTEADAFQRDFDELELETASLSDQIRTSVAYCSDDNNSDIVEARTKHELRRINDGDDLRSRKEVRELNALYSAMIVKKEAQVAALQHKQTVLIDKYRNLIDQKDVEIARLQAVCLDAVQKGTTRVPISDGDLQSVVAAQERRRRKAFRAAGDKFLAATKSLRSGMKATKEIVDKNFTSVSSLMRSVELKLSQFKAQPPQAPSAVSSSDDDEWKTMLDDRDGLIERLRTELDSMTRQMSAIDREMVMMTPATTTTTTVPKRGISTSYNQVTSTSSALPRRKLVSVASEITCTRRPIASQTVGTQTETETSSSLGANSPRRKSTTSSCPNCGCLILSPNNANNIKPSPNLEASVNSTCSNGLLSPTAITGMSPRIDQHTPRTRSGSSAFIPVVEAPPQYHQQATFHDLVANFKTLVLKCRRANTEDKNKVAQIEADAKELQRCKVRLNFRAIVTRIVLRQRIAHLIKTTGVKIAIPSDMSSSTNSNINNNTDMTGYDHVFCFSCGHGKYDVHRHVRCESCGEKLFKGTVREAAEKSLMDLSDEQREKFERYVLRLNKRRVELEEEVAAIHAELQPVRRRLEIDLNELAQRLGLPSPMTSMSAKKIASQSKYGHSSSNNTKPKSPLSTSRQHVDRGGGSKFLPGVVAPPSSSSYPATDYNNNSMYSRVTGKGHPPTLRLGMTRTQALALTESVRLGELHLHPERQQREQTLRRRLSQLQQLGPPQGVVDGEESSRALMTDGTKIRATVVPPKLQQPRKGNIRLTPL